VTKAAVSFVNKVKNAYADVPQTFNDFLTVLREYQRDPSQLGQVCRQGRERLKGKLSEGCS
jgi:histone deacetylase complex regulatory component SIN3